ncbi:MAG TPA: ABC transporter permease [Opitutaceae bacterium]|jgi:lipopolysaccharide transport system permease protein
MRELFEVYRHYRDPVAQFTHRLLHAPSRRSSLKWKWILLQPALMLVAYLITFTFVFPGSYGELATDTRVDYAVAVYLSLTVFNFATDVVSGAPFLFEMHRSLLQHTRLPAEVFVVASLQAAVVRFAISMALCLAIATVMSHVHWTLIWMAPELVAYVFFLLGLSMILAVLGMLYTDLRQLVGLVCTLLMFCSAVFYPSRLLPLWMQRLNPFFQPIDLTRQYVLWGKPFSYGLPGLIVEIIFAVISIGVGVGLLRRHRGVLTE